MTSHDQREHEQLSVLLHEHVDDITLHGTGWPQISRRIHRRQRLHRVAVPVAVLGLCTVGVLGTSLPGLVRGEHSVKTAVGPSSGSRVDPVPAASAAALAFAEHLGVPAASLHAELPAAGGDSTRIELRQSDGAVVCEVLLAPPDATASTWRAVSASAPGVTVRSPQSGAAFDPPLSVAFRTAHDADVTVTLRTVGQAAPLATWSEQVDGSTDWYAQLNYTPQSPGARGLVVVTARENGRVSAVDAFPVLLTSAR